MISNHNRSFAVCLLFILAVLFPGVALAEARLVVLNSDALEVILALGAGEQVVGLGNVVADSPEFWGKLADLPMVGRWNAPSYERIAELRPDAVICYRRNPGPELENRMGALGISVWRYDFFHQGSFVEEVRSLAKQLGKEDAGADYLAWWMSLEETLRRRLEAFSTRPSVYAELYTEYRGAGTGSGLDAMVSLAGGRNLTAETGIPYPEINPEWVVAKRPEWIVKTASLANCYAEDCGPRLESVGAALLKRRGLSATPAARKGQIVILGSDLAAGPRGILGILEIARRLHPQVFADLDVEEIHRDYLKRFMGLPYRGIYAWSPVGRP